MVRTLVCCYVGGCVYIGGEVGCQAPPDACQIIRVWAILPTAITYSFGNLCTLSHSGTGYQVRVAGHALTLSRQ
jgi:hypothetical protein